MSKRGPPGAMSKIFKSERAAHMVVDCKPMDTAWWVPVPVIQSAVLAVLQSRGRRM